jgi:hypothetical protein
MAGRTDARADKPGPSPKRRWRPEPPEYHPTFWLSGCFSTIAVLALAAGVVRLASGVRTGDNSALAAALACGGVAVLALALWALLQLARDMCRSLWQIRRLLEEFAARERNAGEGGGDAC